MIFLSPEMLLLVLIVPVLMAVYLRLLCRKKALALRYANLMYAKEPIGFIQRKGRYIPPLLFLLSLTFLITAVARPALRMAIASKYKTVILAIDASISMRSDGVSPSRIGAARAVARSFVSEQPRSTRIGVVSFAANASVEQAPTSDRNDILEALDRFPLQHGTAIGSAILVSLKMIFPDLEFNQDSSVPRQVALSGNTSTPGNAVGKTIPAGSYPYAAVILLTDGESTMGPEPIAAAKTAAEHGVRVFTVGFGVAGGSQVAGTDHGTMPELGDEKTLKEIAKVTTGEYFNASSTTDLSRIHEALDSRVVFEEKETEISALFAAAGAIFGMLAGSLSMVWFNRVL